MAKAVHGVTGDTITDIMITDTSTIITCQDMVQLECRTHSLSQQDIIPETRTIKFQEVFGNLVGSLKVAKALDHNMDRAMLPMVVSTGDSPDLGSHNPVIIILPNILDPAVKKASTQDNLSSINPRILVLVKYLVIHQRIPGLVSFQEDSSSPRVKRIQAPTSPVFSHPMEIEDTLATNPLIQDRVVVDFNHCLEDFNSQTVKKD